MDVDNSLSDRVRCLYVLRIKRGSENSSYKEPNPKGRVEDGGTKEYCALTYKIVVWNKIIADSEKGNSTYHKTSVFWIPDNFKNIDELWKIERGID